MDKLPIMVKTSCENCSFFERRKEVEEQANVPNGDKAGWCRRNAPRMNVVPVMQMNALTRQPQQGMQTIVTCPIVTTQDWCGDFQPRLFS